jgi:hypothetical protein
MTATTAKVIQLAQPSLNALVVQTKAAWDRADEKKSDADEWYIRTGKLLVELKEKVKEDPHSRWLPTLKKLGRSARRAQELMELAKGDKTIEEHRSRVRKAVAKTKAKAKTALANAHISKAEPQESEDAAGQPIAERWQNSLANLCGDIISHRAYWHKHFPGWEKFDCPSHIKTLMREAAAELASITATVTGR